MIKHTFNCDRKPTTMADLRVGDCFFFLSEQNAGSRPPIWYYTDYYDFIRLDNLKFNHADLQDYPDSEAIQKVNVDIAFSISNGG